MASVLLFSYHYHTHVTRIQIDIDRRSNKDELSIRCISNPSSSVRSALKYQHLDIAERRSGKFCYITWLTVYSLDTLVTANAWEHTYAGSSGTLSNVTLRDRALVPASLSKSRFAPQLYARIQAWFRLVACSVVMLVRRW